MKFGVLGVVVILSNINNVAKDILCDVVDKNIHRSPDVSI